MHFTLATVIAVLPIFTVAAPYGFGPTPKRPTGDQSSFDFDVDNGTSISISKRATLTKLDGCVDLNALKRQMEYTTAKMARGTRNYEKHTGLVHPGAQAVQMAAAEIVARNHGRAVAANALTDDGQALWQGAISVGTPAVKYYVDFDTGSSDLFLPGPSCTNSYCTGHTKYKPTNSSTSKALGKSFSLMYGDGSTVSGNQYTDVVSISGLSAKGQTLGAASQYSSGFAKSRFPPDGLLGMGFQSISNYGASPLFQSLVTAKKTTSPVFAFKLATSGSELYVGGVHSTLYKGAFSYAPVTQEGYWRVNFDKASANGKSILGSTSSIIDTGTTLIIGTPVSVAKIYASIPGALSAASTIGEGYFTFPCNTDPKLSFTFGGKTFPVSLSSFNLGRLNSASNQCVGGLIGSNIAGIGWIMGDVFLQNTYTAFDFGNKRVGFATLA